ncbi:hypothetical protein C772_00264 [Bhargavaea cecembensis DSE10]|uniref:Uncharacterized protein n=1 Tax=Bhargavaea cecembensis DSE10 TaxID=1235279 RepID=M7P231_9BACL|nr:hypothetical protein [Bhargavaea cecembensis]EMR07935.1 hypothetical protein C772_00264 [Bhargavaea cecembensis DSE10]
MAYSQNEIFNQHLSDDVIFVVGETKGHAMLRADSLHDIEGGGKVFYITIPSTNISETSTVTIVPEGEINESLMIRDASRGRNLVTAPATIMVTPYDVIIPPNPSSENQ